MFGLGKKNKEKKEITSQEAAGAVVNSVLSDADNNAEKLKALSNAQAAIDEFNSKFERELLSKDLFGNNPEKNAEKLKEIEERFEQAKKNYAVNPNQALVEIDLKRRRDFYYGFTRLGTDKTDERLFDSIYFLPQDKDKYINAIGTLSRAFREKRSAFAVYSGADNIFLNGAHKYIDELARAIREGQKITANACIDIFKYILTVAFEPPTGFLSEEQISELYSKRNDVVFNTGPVMIESLKRYYTELNSLELLDNSYKSAKHDYAEKQGELENCPVQIVNQLLNLDLQNSLQTIPQTALVKQYYPIVNSAKTTLVFLYVKDYQIRSTIQGIYDTKTSIIILMDEFQQAYINKNADFDFDKYAKRLSDITTKNINDSRKLQEQAIAIQKMNKTAESLLKEAESIAELGVTVATSTQSVFRQMEIDKENEELMKEIAKKKIDNEKKRAQAIKQEEENPAEENKQEIENEELV